MCSQHLKSKLGLEVKDSRIPNAGEGLFTTIDRRKGEDICTYSGDVILEIDTDDEDYVPYSGAYVVQVKKGVLIDAAKTNSEGRYINAARNAIVDGKKLHNNVQMVYNARKRVVNIRAKKKIKAGSELYMGYGTGYWKFFGW